MRLSTISNVRSRLVSAAIFGAICLAFAQAEAASGSPVLSKRSTSTSGSGKVRSSECLIYKDGVVINRNADGVLTTEEKSFKIGGTLDAKIADVAAGVVEIKPSSPLEFSYSMIAYQGTKEFIIGAFDGVKGEESYNPAPSVIILREILNSTCNN